MDFHSLIQWTFMVVTALSVIYIWSVTYKQIVKFIKDNQMTYEFQTTFQTGYNLMRHDFSNRVSVLTNIATGKVQIVSDGELIKEYDDVSLDRYDMILHHAGQISKEKESPRRDPRKVITSKN